MTENEPQDTQPSAELMLVQVSEDAALVFGADSPSWLEVQPFLGASSADRAHLHEAAALAVGGLNVALQISPALMAAQGIVQLSPTTMAALRTLEPIVGANGWNLGTLRAAGKFAHSVQWAPASGAAGLQFATNMGPAMTLVAIQLQLKDISRKLDQNIDLTKEVLTELGWANDAELVSLVRDVHRAYSEALHVGAVTPQIYGEIRGKEDRIDKARTLLLTRVSAYVTELEQADNPESRRKWLSDRAERSLNDLRSLVQVQQAWFVFQALRAANVAESDTSERGIKLTARIRETAQEQNRITADLVIALADRLQRMLGLLQESGDRRLGRFKSAAEARQVAQALRAKVLDALPAVDRALGTPEVFLGRSSKLERASRMLPLVLEQERPQTLAASCELGAFNSSAFLFVLPGELVLTREKALFNDHALDHQVPSHSIRYVRTDAKKRTVELVAVERTFKLEWPSDASDVDVTYANDLLKSLMSLPPEEIPQRPRSTAALLASVAALAGELDS
ncbi:hypothetical protein ACFFOM_15310 [Microlunatus capsulatus]|uniref:Uncharacterized protein n=1 Tax=Microlunatus capsulatus TaxID=99117 RepID=A0ABS4Z761_9ACTN|nr:hypothetical protein [Microlunatus capsulatus]MBP2416883.1 hypothetical protein [Microlunatus capsulatus]